MTIDCRVISIGAIGAHPLWNEKGERRPPHATTTLIRSGTATILVDPSLPPKPLEARLDERAGLAPSQITHVFLTCLHPMHRRGLGLFPEAELLVNSVEREAVGIHLVNELKTAHEAGDEELVRTLATEVEVVRRIGAAPDTLTEGVDLFPLPGVTPGMAGLLVSQPTTTILICGDAIPTIEHLEQARMHQPCHDVEIAQQSFREAIEIADLLVLGRDNMILNPVRRAF